MKRSIMFFGLSLIIAKAVSADDAVLIGGGYNLHGSQGQIELNVNWVQDVLQSKGMKVETYFTDGSEAGADVYYQLPPDEQSSALEPLARVFADRVLEARRYRENKVANLSGSTRRPDLEPALGNIINRTADSDLLLVYNGHGSQSSSTPDHVTMELWDNTRLSANELHSMLEPRSAPFRFVFAQCYSGGFHRLAYDNPTNGLALSDAPRCGFTAESAYRLAEGCSASIETDDYRDYTTFFFAALSGFERDGEIIGRDPDINSDGQTTLREAHLFTVQEAYSTDLSRSTSEDYLMRWQPWYLRWLPVHKNLPNNQFAKMYRELAARYGIALDSSAVKQIRQKLAQSHAEYDDTMAQSESLNYQIHELQFELQRGLSEQWPAILGPYTGAFQKLAASGQLNGIAADLAQTSEYQQLVDLQHQKAVLDETLLDRERMATQFQKLIHLRHLATVEQQLFEYGSAQEQDGYRSLVSCEDVALLD